MELGLRRLLSLVQELYFASSPGALATVSTHLVTQTAVLKLISFFLFPLTKKKATSVFRALANHSASLSLSLPHPVRRFIQTICPYTPFFIHPVTECKPLLAFILTWICYFGREILTYTPYSSFNGQSLAACQFKHGGVGEISYFSPLSGRPRDNYKDMKLIQLNFYSRIKQY